MSQRHLCAGRKMPRQFFSRSFRQRRQVSFPYLRFFICARPQGRSGGRLVQGQMAVCLRFGRLWSVRRPNNLLKIGMAAVSKKRSLCSGYQKKSNTKSCKSQVCEKIFLISPRFTEWFAQGRVFNISAIILKLSRPSKHNLLNSKQTQFNPKNAGYA